MIGSQGRRGLRRLLAACALGLAAWLAAAPAAAAWEPICVTASPPAGWTEQTEGPTADGYARAWGVTGNDTDGPGGTYREYEARVGFEQAAYGASQGRITTLQEFLDDVAAGRASVPVHRVYAMEEIAEAHADMEAGRATGKLVVALG